MKRLHLNLRYWLYEYGWLVAILVIILGLGGLVLHFAKPSPFSSLGYEWADVKFTNSIAAVEAGGFRFAVWIETVDGKTATLRTRSLSLAHTVGKTACVERRAHQNGAVRFRLVHPRHCA